MVIDDFLSPEELETWRERVDRATDLLEAGLALLPSVSAGEPWLLPPVGSRVRRARLLASLGRGPQECRYTDALPCARVTRRWPFWGLGGAGGSLSHEKATHIPGRANR